MIKKRKNVFWVIVIILATSIIYTSYSTLLEKDLIIIEE